MSTRPEDVTAGWWLVEEDGEREVVRVALCKDVRGNDTLNVERVGDEDLYPVAELHGSLWDFHWLRPLDLEAIAREVGA